MTDDTVRCDYCMTQISNRATRCPHCAGELKWCPRCVRNVATDVKSKFVGILRGGRQDQHRCRHCHTMLSGPRF